MAHLTMKVVRMSGPDERVELPSYFRDNPWVEILAHRGIEPEEPLARSALSTAGPAQASPSPVKASSAPQGQGQEIAQLINALMGMVVRSSQAQVAHAQAGVQPMVVVVPIIIQMPVPYPVTAQRYGIGGCGGVLCTPRNGENAELVFQGTPSPPPRPAAPGKWRAQGP